MAKDTSLSTERDKMHEWLSGLRALGAPAWPDVRTQSWRNICLENLENQVDCASLRMPDLCLTSQGIRNKRKGKKTDFFFFESLLHVRNCDRRLSSPHLVLSELRILVRGAFCLQVHQEGTIAPKFDTDPRVSGEREDSWRCAWGSLL